MKLGISTKCFGGISTDEAAEKIKQCGYEAVELCMCQSDAPYRHYNATGHSPTPTMEEFLKICRKYTDRGLEIAALCANINLWCAGSKAKTLAGLSMADYMELALSAGIKIISTELGFSIASRPIRGNAVNRKSYTPAELSELEKAFCFVSLEAAKRGIDVCIHPCEADPVWCGVCKDGTFSTPGKAELYAEFIERVENMSGVKNVLKLAVCPFSFGESGKFDRQNFSGLEKLTHMLYVKERSPESRYFTHAGANAGAGFGISQWHDFFKLFENAEYAIAEYVDDRSAAHVCSYISAAIK